MLSQDSPLRRNEQALKAELKRQFEKLHGKEVSHSVSTKGLELSRCGVDTDKIRKFRDHRLLLHFDARGNGFAEVLPMNVELHFFPGKGWGVHSFASTAF